MGVLNLIPALFSKISRAVIKKGKEWGIGGNMHGDGFQNGGLIVVEAKGEKILYEFKQDNPADHAPNSAILEALGIELTEGAEAEECNEALNVTDLECEEVCAMPAKE
ncbi:prostamide/prostaglandin F synthase-like [Palaemon carinicauda]|uniref:prostamide/prostaglandin F synthase-like n=1 Tax=Palaemon carinicauda TaxID=392227 RepID=UPI0035B6A29A